MADDAQQTNNALTRLLLHFDGSDGDTTFVDSAVGNIATHSFSGGGVLSSDQARFGPTSLRCYGVNGGVRVAAAPDWNFGNSAWTIDCWIYPLFGPVSPFCFYLDDDNYMGFVSQGVAQGESSSNARMRFAYKLNGRMIDEDGPAVIGVALNQWNHIQTESMKMEL